jgi:hypothetical protein
MHPTSAFIRDKLVPHSVDGSHNRFYELNPNSVTPSRIVGSDEYGMPIEERIPLAMHMPFVGLDGCVKNVTLRTHPCPDNEEDAARYGTSVLRDIIRGGQLPLNDCPYTNQYRDIKAGPLVKPPEGAVDCGGKEGGCEHMHAVIKARKAKARAKWDEDQKNARALKQEDLERMVAAMSDGVGRAIANADPKANRRNLAQGKGEVD